MTNQQEFNSETAIGNIGYLCGQDIEEVPYWETINNCLKGVDPDGLQDTVCKLVKGLIRSRAFEKARIRGGYWQLVVDGTQLYSSREKPDGKCLYRVHNRGTEKEHTEYYYYVVETKIVLHSDIYVSMLTEFAENQEEAEKQDCERKAFCRLTGRLREQFPMLPVCVSGDSLYACGPFFEKCRERRAAGTCCASRRGASPAYMKNMGSCAGWKRTARRRNMWYRAAAKGRTGKKKRQK